MRLSRTTRVAFVLAALSSAGVVALSVLVAACAEDAPSAPAPVDAAPDVALLAEGGPPEAGTVAGDACGDTRGLLAGAPWPLRGGCPKRAGVSSRRTPSDATLKWSVALPAAASDAVVEPNAFAWVGTAAGEVLAVASSGVVAASVDVGGPVTGAPALAASGVVVVGAGDALVGVRRGSGAVGADAGVDGGEDAGDAAPRPTARVVFRLALPGAPSSPVIAGDGTIYVGTRSGVLVAVAPDGASVRWTAETGDALGSAPAIGDDGTVYVGSSAGHLDAVAPDGRRVFRYETGASVTGSPAVGPDGVVYVGTKDGALHAVGKDGVARFRYATGGAIEGTPAVHGGTVYVGSTDKKLHAVATSDGKARWTFATLGELGTPSVSSEGDVVVGATDAKLYVISPSGLLVFAANARGAVRASPAFSADGTIVIGTDKGITAVGP